MYAGQMKHVRGMHAACESLPYIELSPVLHFTLHMDTGSDMKVRNPLTRKDK
jgi:hypothetical protein